MTYLREAPLPVYIIAVQFNDGRVERLSRGEGACFMLMEDAGRQAKEWNDRLISPNVRYVVVRDEITG
jgi:hypothetical protein